MAKLNTAHVRHPFAQAAGQASWLHRNWWVMVFIGLCALVYLHAMRQKDHSFQEMAVSLRALEKEKAEVLTQQEELLLQIHSQSDSAWVEMVLKANLGMVPEGQTKVYFKN
ncbi:MAG: hypothetical protein JSS10_03910 [Verrucomicrobia bacterium]|nr:hypothetical protein [Verrucomicrobiota bacterium]